MRVTATLLNLLLLGFVVYVLATEGLPDDAELLIFVVVLVSVPLVNIAALYLAPRETWLRLYLQRRALEERKKIEKLKEGQ